jgi:hypothetical protein
MIKDIKTLIMNKESLVKVQLDYQTIGEEISHELGAKMIKDHHDKKAVGESKSYIIGRTIIDQILAQPGCVGLRIFDALNENGEKTLVYVGIDSKGNNLLEFTSVNNHGKIVVTEGMIGDKINTTSSWFG